MSDEGKVTILWNHQVRTNRTIPDNKLDIIIRDTKQRTCMLTDVAVPGDICDQVRSREDLKYKRRQNRISADVECESKSDTSNNRGDWNHFKITRTIPE